MALNLERRQGVKRHTAYMSDPVPRPKIPVEVQTHKLDTNIYKCSAQVHLTVSRVSKFHAMGRQHAVCSCMRMHANAAPDGPPKPPSS